MAQEGEEEALVVDHAAEVVDEVGDIAAGLQQDPEIGSRVAHVIGDALSQALEVFGAQRRTVLVYEAVDPEDVTTQASEQTGTDEAHGAIGEIDDDLRRTRADRGRVQNPEEARRVLLERMRRVLQLPE